MDYSCFTCKHAQYCLHTWECYNDPNGFFCRYGYESIDEPQDNNVS